jgi:TP901 family phage tail tape measure protein
VAISVGTGVVRIVPDFTGFATTVKRGVGTSFAQIGNASRDAGRALLPLSVAAGGVIAASAAMAVQFEKDFVKIEALVGDTAENLALLRPLVLDLARTSGIGPRELADALFFVESAGLRGAAAFEVLQNSARAAAVGLGNTAQVADALTSAVNAYASTGLTAADATDVLVASVREGKIEADTLAASIGRVIPIAAQLGVEFNEVGAAIAASTRVGLTAEEATTALRQALVTLLKPSAQAQATLKEFGFSAQGLRKAIADDGLLATLQLMFERFGDNQEAVNKVFQNVRALTGIFALVGGNAEQVQGVFDRLANSTGDLDKAFEATQKGTAFQLSVAMAELERAAISLGDVFLPVLISIAGVISTVANAFAELSDPIKDAVARMLVMVALSAPLLLVAGSLLRTAAAATIVRGAHTQAAVAATQQASAELALASASNIAATAQGRVAAASGARAATGGQLVGRGFKAFGLLVAADIAGGIIQGIDTEAGSTAEDIKNTLASAVRGAGVGASIGFLIGGPVGAGIGAGIGAGLGGLIGFVRSQAGDLVEEIAEVFDPLNNIEFAQSQGIALGLALAESIEEGIAEIEIEPIFDALQETIAENTEDLTASLTAFATAVPSLFSNAFEEEEDHIALTLTDIFSNVAAELAAFNELDEGLKDLGRRGLLALAESISNEGGPAALEAMREVRQGLIDDPASIFALEADLNRLEGDLRTSFTSFLGRGGIETGGIGENLSAFLLPEDLAALGDGIVALFTQELPTIGERFVAVAGPVFKDALLESFRIGVVEAASSEDILPENLDEIITGAIGDADILKLVKIAIKELRVEFGGVDLDLEGTTFPDVQIPVLNARTGQITMVDPPPITLSEQFEILNLEGFDFFGLNVSLAEELKTWAQEDLPALLAETDFSSGDLTIEEALVDAFAAKIKTLTAEAVALEVETDAVGAGIAISTVASILSTFGPVGVAFSDEIKAQIDNVRTRAAARTAAKGPGGKLADGLLAGWDLRFPSVRSQIVGDVASIPDAIDRILDNRSPSRVFARIGTDIVDGLNMGIQSVPVADISIPSVIGPGGSGGSSRHIEVNIHNPSTRNLVRDTDKALRLVRTSELMVN